MGDASGTVEMVVNQVVPPSYNVYPFVAFSMKRPFWPHDIPGRLFLEPAGWGSSILQVYQTDWENLGPTLHRQERMVIVSFWAEAFRRAQQVCKSPGLPSRASPWVLSDVQAGSKGGGNPNLVQAEYDGNKARADIGLDQIVQYEEVSNNGSESDGKS
jgi:hypothetical protein